MRPMPAACVAAAAPLLEVAVPAVAVAVPSAEAMRPEAEAVSEVVGFVATSAQIWGAREVASVGKDSG